MVQEALFLLYMDDVWHTCTCSIPHTLLLFQHYVAQGLSQCLFISGKYVARAWLASQWKKHWPQIKDVGTWIEGLFVGNLNTDPYPNLSSTSTRKAYCWVERVNSMHKMSVDCDWCFRWRYWGERREERTATGGGGYVCKHLYRKSHAVLHYISRT